MSLTHLDKNINIKIVDNKKQELTNAAIFWLNVVNCVVQ